MAWLTRHIVEVYISGNPYNHASARGFDRVASAPMHLTVNQRHIILHKNTPYHTVLIGRVNIFLDWHEWGASVATGGIDMTMIEKIARALFDRETAPLRAAGIDMLSWDELRAEYEAQYQRHIEEAKTALHALMEPTAKMIDAGNDVPEEIYCAANCYFAIIQGALGEGTISVDKGG